MEALSVSFLSFFISETCGFNTRAQAHPLPVPVKVASCETQSEKKEKKGASVGTGRAKLINAVFASVFVLICRLHF